MHHNFEKSILYILWYYIQECPKGVPYNVPSPSYVDVSMNPIITQKIRPIENVYDLTIDLNQPTPQM
jgi:hypothetical protein